MPSMRSLENRIIWSLPMTTTQTQLRLAKRMSRLGTETAFEVLVRARALEAQGKHIVHLEIGEPNFDTPANVVVPGGKPIIFFTMLALVEEGDEVIYPNPGFPIYESMINFLGGKAVAVQVREDRDFRVDVNEIKDRITDRTKLIIVNSPYNPTGGVMTRGDVEDLAAAIGDRDIMVLSDEI